MEQMKCTRCQHLLKEIQDQVELVPHLVKIKIREEIEEVIDNKISNLAVEQMEEKEWEQMVWEDQIEIIDKVDRL